MGVHTPPARMAMRSGLGVGRPSDGVPGPSWTVPILKEGGVIHPEGANVARIGVEDIRGEEAALGAVEGDIAGSGGIVGIIDSELEKAPFVDPVVVGDHGVVELDGGQIR